MNRAMQDQNSTSLTAQKIDEICEHIAKSGNVGTSASLSGISRDELEQCSKAVQEGRGSKLQNELIARTDAALQAYSDKMLQVVTDIANAGGDTQTRRNARKWLKTRKKPL